MSTTLARVSQESLFVWKYPFTNLGGAGTFFPDNEGAGGYPSTGTNGSTLHLGNQGLAQTMKPPEMTGFSMGPFDPDVETTRGDRIDERMRMMYKGFEGDFFDADEAEKYLRQRGIVIPANVDFVDAEIDLTSLDEPTDLSGFGTSNSFFGAHQSPASGQGLYMPHQQSAANISNMWQSTIPTSVANTTSSTIPAPLMAPTLGPDMTGLIPQFEPTNGGQYSQGLGSFVDTTFFPREWTSSSSWMKTKVTVDVNRLVAGEFYAVDSRVLSSILTLYRNNE
jgi:hypothetical protein